MSSEVLDAKHIKHIKGFVGMIAPGYLESFTSRLMAIRSEAMTHHFNVAGRGVAVTSRPKQVYCRRNDRGEFGLYFWGQVKEDFMLVTDLPGFADEFLALVVNAVVALITEQMPECRGMIPFIRQMNHMLLTFGDNGTKGIPPHNDKAYSSKTLKGQYESGTPILLFNFGARRKFLISTNNASSKAGVHDTEQKMRADGVFVKAMSFEGGDLIILPGACNVAYKHSVELDSSITAPRVSIVLRMVDADTVHPEQNYYMRKGKRFEGDAQWPRQPPLPDALARPLQPLPSTSSSSAAEAGDPRLPDGLYSDEGLSFMQFFKMTENDFLLKAKRSRDDAFPETAAAASAPHDLQTEQEPFVASPHLDCI